MINAFLFAALCGFLGAGFAEVLFCRVYPMRLKTFTFDWGVVHAAVLPYPVAIH